MAMLSPTTWERVISFDCQEDSDYCTFTGDAEAVFVRGEAWVVCPGCGSEQKVEDYR